MAWQLRRQGDRQYYPSFCLARLAGSILVVAIHGAPFPPEAAGLNFLVQHWLARIAVPFFFASSGYFLYRKTTLEQFDPGPTKAFVLRMLRIYLIWTAIFFPLSAQTYRGDEKGFVHSVLWYIRSFLFEGSYFHLWYLPAVIVAVLLVSYLLHKKVSPPRILCAAGALYLAGLLGQSWFGLIRPLETAAPAVWSGLKLVQKVIRTTRNGLFDGFLFVGIGMLFAFYEIRLARKTALLGFAGSMLLVLAEGVLLERAGFARMHDAYLTLPLALFFGFALVLGARPPAGRHYAVLQDLSALVYFLHPLVGAGPLPGAWLDRLAGAVGISAYFPKALLYTLLVSAVILLLARLPGFGWLKKAYH